MAPVPAKRYKKPDYRKKVERMLREYPILKLAIEEEQIPSCTPLYEERTSSAYSEYNSMTEKYAVRMADKKLQVKKLEKALQVLNLDERELVKTRYFDLAVLTDEAICEKLGWSKRSYYRIKRNALNKIALAMNLL
jgi:ArpU family phage transcriptional regulator